MITAGIDVGARNTKAVIVKDGSMLSHGMVPTGANITESAEKALGQALSSAGISRDKVERIMATGSGRQEVKFADDTTTDMVADGKGINHFFPSVRTAIDIGDEENRAFKVTGEGKMVDFSKNDKCAAGVGAFVESMATALEVKLSDMQPLALESKVDVDMNVTCVVFAESEVVSQIHAGTSKPDIARAILNVIATRTSAMVRRLGAEDDVALMGGVASNVAVQNLMKSHLKADNIKVAENPYIVGALGAALIAAE